MIKGEFKGKRICFREEDHEKLLERFDKKNAVRIQKDRY